MRVNFFVVISRASSGSILYSFAPANEKLFLAYSVLIFGRRIILELFLVCKRMINELEVVPERIYNFIV